MNNVNYPITHSYYFEGHSPFIIAVHIIARFINS